MNYPEVWKDVTEYEGMYMVSDLGRVKSLPKRRNISNGNTRLTRERILCVKPGIYPTVTLASFGKNETKYIHELVLLAFVGRRPNGMECCHGDGNKWNPSLSNLRWDTPSGNHADRVKHGVDNRGERCGTSKLTEPEIKEIRTRKENGESNSAVAAAFGVCAATVSLIHNRRIWSHVL